VTPMRHRQQASSAERVVVLHKDKKWVQEQSQLIAEYLDDTMRMHPLPGFTSEFFSRGAAALRQITTKQFVSILNFFLQCSFGSRFNVGSNHIEDITNALHKLKYPYQVSKSWLMTPTTQHSYGHVIVMLDFLKDMAPSHDPEQYEEFAFTDTCEVPRHDSMALSNTQISPVSHSEDTNRLLFASAAESFGVWDTQNWDEYNALKRNVSDKIIQHLCDVPNDKSLDADIDGLESELKLLDEQLQLPADSELVQLQQLRAREQQMSEELQMTQANTKEHVEKIKHLLASSTQIASRKKMLHKELQQLQREVDSQKCSIEQLQAMKVLLGERTNELQFHQRQMIDFTERGNYQQVCLSRAKKKLLDNVEKFNVHAQNIGIDSDICRARGTEQLDLVLPLPPQHHDIQERRRRLVKLAALLEQRSAQHEKRCVELEQLKSDLTLQTGKLKADISSLNAQMQSCTQQMMQLSHNFKASAAKRSKYLEQLIANNLEFRAGLEQLHRNQQQLARLLQSKEQQIDDFLTDAEQRQRERLSAQDAFVKEHTQMLAQAEAKITEFKENITSNGYKVADLKQQLESLALPSIDEELDAVYDQ
ncbi:hypothetical protein KR222_002807, partial [Zaprionus bogoriensis]